jgi:hypothetical protein
LLVGRRSLKDILPPRALQHRQTSGNAPILHFVIGSHSKKTLADESAGSMGSSPSGGFRFNKSLGVSIVH